MAGAVLENLSTRKLMYFVAALLLLQIASFLLGALKAPNPTTANTHLATKCIDRKFDLKQWFRPWGPHACEKVKDFDEATRLGVQADWIAFSVQMPNRPFAMSPWFQYLIGVLAMDIVYDEKRRMRTDADVTLVIKLGYLDDNDDDEVKELVSVNETRKLTCFFPHDEVSENEGYQYDCDPIPLFELGSVHHASYILNIRLPVVDEKGLTINTDIGSLQDMNIVEIHQNGGFTKVWVSMKTVFFPIVLFTMLWFWKRVMGLERPAHLLERTILALAIVMSVLNFPLEWIAIWVDAPAMTLVSDLRQGALYAMLFSFWIIFVGEHLMDQAERNRLKVYWRQVSAITFACFCLFLFDVCERGVQLSNPFFSIWNTETGKKLALAFIISAATCGVLYFFFLCFMVWKVFKNISMRRATLPHMAKARRLHYEGLIYRFRFFMLMTLLCAIMTVIFFILSQVNEGQWKWGEDEAKSTVQYTSAFFTGVYGMWNIYVLAVLVLYAPSHKHVSTSNGDTNSGSNVEFELDSTTSAGPSTSTGGPTTGGAAAARSTLPESYQLLSKVAAD